MDCFNYNCAAEKEQQETHLLWKVQDTGELTCPLPRAVMPCSTFSPPAPSPPGPLNPPAQKPPLSHPQYKRIFYPLKFLVPSNF